MNEKTETARVEPIVMRIDAANEFIESIASHGRRFFEYVHHDGRQVAHFRRGEWGHIFFWNQSKRQWIYVSRYGAWKGFHHGGTLRSLVGQLVEYIRTGKQLRGAWFDGKHWGYGAEMAIVVQIGQRLGVIQSA